MKHIFLALLLSMAVFAATAPQFDDEQLTYNINWPSGLSLGEGHLQAKRSKAVDGTDRWDLELTLDASIPGFNVRDKFHSSTGKDFASLQFDKNSQHGQRTAKEKITFDPQKGTITRETLDGGGSSDLSLPPSTRDALAFLYYARKELSQGRVPPAQAVVFGAPYQVRLDYTGAQTLRIGEQSVQADGCVVFIKGPASTFSFEVFFARDPGRTPLLVRVPLAMGAFLMELAR